MNIRRNKSLFLPYFLTMAAMGEHDLFRRGGKEESPTKTNTWHDDERVEKAKQKRAMRNAKRLKHWRR